MAWSGSSRPKPDDSYTKTLRPALHWPRRRAIVFPIADRNGRISAAEHAAGARAMFLAMDADKDGRVTSREMGAAQGKVGSGRRSGMSSAEKIRVIDSNHDGVLSAEEHQAGSEVMFALMDRNKDGKLTRGEYSAGHAKLLKK